MRLHVALCAVLLSASSQAFPPAPYYTLYGMVRDQVGQTVSAEGAEIILLKDGVEAGRAPVTTGLDHNYELALEIDQNRPGTDTYSDNAVAAQGQFSLAVEMNGALFYPIEVAGDLTAGKGSERVRLDLNLGEDTDRDGLPDIWEQWQLFQGGYNPDAQGVWDLSLISKEGDLDGDGQADGFEYITGTFAGDAEEHFGLEIKEKLEDTVRFEFYAIIGKTYTIETSSDLKNWSRVPLAVGDAAATSASYRATEVGILSAFTAPGTTGSEIFRLTVR